MTISGLTLARCKRTDRTCQARPVQACHGKTKPDAPPPGVPKLAAQTGLFYLGLLTLFLPLGMGVGALATVFLEQRSQVTLIAGLILVALGFFQLVSGGFAVPGSSLPQGRIGGESAVASYSLGLICGIGGFCSGPILGGVLTMAASAGGAVPAAALLTLLAAGMALWYCCAEPSDEQRVGV